MIYKLHVITRFVVSLQDNRYGSQDQAYLIRIMNSVNCPLTRALFVVSASDIADIWLCTKRPADRAIDYFAMLVHISFL